MIAPTVVRAHGAQGVMDKIPGQRARRNLSAAVALIMAFPAVAMGWGILKVLFGPGRWGPKLITLSIFGNVLFVFVLILGYYVSEADRGSAEEEAALLGPDFVPCLDAPLHFVEARPESELGSMSLHHVYLSFRGIIRANFEFVDGEMDTLKKVQVSDKYGRLDWISARLEDGKLYYTRYHGDKGAEGDVTLIDEDGDGIPDVMIDWNLRARFEREQELTWRLVKKVVWPED